MEHLQFKGIELEGNVNEFCDKLVSKGFEVTEKQDDAAALTGIFAGKKAGLYIKASSITNNVGQVMVVFEPSSYYSSWSIIKTHYLELKYQLQNKYGSPESSTEMFMEPYYDGDGFEMLALESNCVFYLTTFKVECGLIGISMVRDTICLTYTDNIYSRELQNASDNCYDDL